MVFSIKQKTIQNIACLYKTNKVTKTIGFYIKPIRANTNLLFFYCKTNKDQQNPIGFFYKTNKSKKQLFFCFLKTNEKQIEANGFL